MCRLRGMFVFLLVGFGLAAVAPAAMAQPKDKAKRSAERVRNYLKQLAARFDAWDTNKDATLDAKELAKAFRGAGAVPLDKLKVALPVPAATVPMPPDVDYTQTGKARPISLALITFPQYNFPVNAALAELLVDRPRTATPPPKVTPPPMVTDFTAFGDFQFLSLAGKGADWKLARADFDAYAKTYARTLDHLEEAEYELKQAKAHLDRAKTEKGKKGKADVAKAQNEVATAQTNLGRAQAEWNAIPLNVRTTLNVKH
ncbi:MAG: hypothetical protein U0793_20605 [Gemmataceae bacterium]